MMMVRYDIVLEWLAGFVNNKRRSGANLLPECIVVVARVASTHNHTSLKSLGGYIAHE